MKLHRLSDVVPDSTGLVCRQSTLRSAAWAVILSLVLIVPSAFLWWANIHPLRATIWTVIAVVIMPSMIRDVRRTFRRTNWLVWIRFDRLWINVRSYQDESPTDTDCVVQFDYREIAEVSQHVEAVSPPGSKGRSNPQRITSLDIRLKQADTGELVAALAQARQRPQPGRTYLGFFDTTNRPSSFPVALAEPDLIRIAWRGGTDNMAAPSLSRVLAELAPCVKVGEPTRRDEKGHS